MESARHFEKHWHTTYGLGCLVRGAQSSASGRGTVDAYAGDVITTNPGEVHDGRPLGGASRHWRMAYVEPEVIAQMAAVPGVGPTSDMEVTRPVINDDELRRALTQLFRRIEHWSEQAHADPASNLACEESLTETCGLLLARYGARVPADGSHSDLVPVRDRLADALQDPPTLTELAAMAGLSKYQLLRAFKRTFGVPPYVWLRLRRAERARDLIRRGARLAHAAVASGFSDQSHMTRSFVRHFGFTPGAWQAGTSSSARLRNVP